MIAADCFLCKASKRRVVLVSILLSGFIVLYLSNTLFKNDLFQPAFRGANWLQSYGRDMYARYLGPQYKLLNCSHVNSSIFNANQNYTHKMVVVKMAEFWSKKYIEPRTVYCPQHNQTVLAISSNGDIFQTCSADIVVIAGVLKSASQWAQLQFLRTVDQIWVHTTEESPFNTRRVCPGFKMNYIRFNLTVSYHPKADISTPYAKFSPFQLSSKRKPSTLRSYFAEKPKLIVWISSHCFTKMWLRKHFAYDLAKLIPVEMFGKCGQLQCKLGNHSCVDIFKRYKFVLALENSCCEGYITEKFWNTLAFFNAIPVVVGAPKSDYERLAPNNSFIHADDFGSIKELAEYILKVSQNKELYDSYFQWQQHGTIQRNGIDEILAFTNKGICKLMNYLASKRSVQKENTFDPYGPDWFGGCFPCGEKSWLRKYVPLNVTELIYRPH